MKNKDEVQRDLCMQVYLDEYRTLREEILLRMKERNSTVYYILLLISALVVAIWQIPGRVEPEKTFVIFLLIIPIAFFFLAFIYCWHDIMIARLGGYINKILRPKLMDVCGCADILEWGRYLKESSTSRSWKIMAFFNRLILVVPIPISTICLFVLMKPQIFGTVRLVLVIFNLLLFVGLLVLFLFIDRIYTKARQ